MSEKEAKSETAFKFKSSRNRKPLRKRKNSDDEDEKAEDEASTQSDFNRDKLQETLELQKLRQRTGGVSHVTLASGKKLSKVEEIVAADPDPFKLKSGGLLTLKAAKAAHAMEDPSANDPNQMEEVDIKRSNLT